VAATTHKPKQGNFCVLTLKPACRLADLCYGRQVHKLIPKLRDKKRSVIAKRYHQQGGQFSVRQFIGRQKTFRFDGRPHSSSSRFDKNILVKEF
jgi:hypothetical protein